MKDWKEGDQEILRGMVRVGTDPKKIGIRNWRQ